MPGSAKQRHISRDKLQKYLKNKTVEEKTAIKRLIERRRCQEDLWYLYKEYIEPAGKERLAAGVHRKLCAFLDDNDTGLVLMPRGWLKSSIATCAKAIQTILIDPNRRLCILAATLKLAYKFLATIKAHLTNPRLVDLFPEILEVCGDNLPEWKEASITVKRTLVSDEPTIIVGSVLSQPTGHHCDDLFLDDLQIFENSTTPEQIAKVIDAARNALNTIAEPSARRHICGTRYGDDDLYAHLMKDNVYPLYYVDCYLFEGTRNMRSAWCEKFTLSTLKAMEKDMGVYMFSCQMRNRPVLDGEQLFRPEWFRYYERDDLPYRYIYIALDPAISKRKEADFSVFTYAGQNCLGKLFVGEQIVMKEEPSKLIDTLFELYAEATRQAEDVIVGIETVLFAKMLKFTIEEEQLRRGVIFEVRELVPSSRVNKVRRIRNLLQPLFERGDIYIRTGRKWAEKLVYQLERLGLTAKDDQADSLAMIVDLLQPLELVTANAYRVIVPRLQEDAGSVDFDARDYDGIDYDDHPLDYRAI